MPTNPCIIAFVSISPNLLTALDKTTIDVAKSNIPAPLRTPIPLRSVTFIKSANSVNTTPTPTNPCLRIPPSIDPNFSTAVAITMSAAANAIIPPAPFIILPSIVDNTLAEPTSNIIDPANPARPVFIASHSMPDNFLIADDKANIETANGSIARATFVIPLKPPPDNILLNTAMDPNS